MADQCASVVLRHTGALFVLEIKVVVFGHARRRSNEKVYVKAASQDSQAKCASSWVTRQGRSLQAQRPCPVLWVQGAGELKIARDLETLGQKVVAALQCGVLLGEHDAVGDCGVHCAQSVCRRDEKLIEVALWDVCSRLASMTFFSSASPQVSSRNVPKTTSSPTTLSWFSERADAALSVGAIT
jgi:hypothetical protein